MNLIDAIYKLLTKNKLVVISIILITLIGTFLPFLAKNEVEDNTNIIINNSTLTSSPIIQDSSNISINYNQISNSDIWSPYYQQGIYYNKDLNMNIYGDKYDFFNVKFILPDNQEIFIDTILFNTTYEIASCNNKMTDCRIPQKYRNTVDILDENVCWIFTTRLGHEEIVSDSLGLGDRMYSNPEECFKPSSP